MPARRPRYFSSVNGRKSSELAPIFSQQALGYQQHQHRIVALERGENIGIGLERGKAVDGQVALSATALARCLKSLDIVLGAVGFQARGEGFDLTLVVFGAFRKSACQMP